MSVYRNWIRNVLTVSTVAALVAAVPAAVIAWLARDPAATGWNGKTVFAQKLALKLELHPDWRR